MFHLLPNELSVDNVRKTLRISKVYLVQYHVFNTSFLWNISFYNLLWHRLTSFSWSFSLLIFYRTTGYFSTTLSWAILSIRHNQYFWFGHSIYFRFILQVIYVIIRNCTTSDFLLVFLCFLATNCFPSLPYPLNYFPLLSAYVSEYSSWDSIVSLSQRAIGDILSYTVTVYRFNVHITLFTRFITKMVKENIGKSEADALWPRIQYDWATEPVAPVIVISVFQTNDFII